MVIPVQTQGYFVAMEAGKIAFSAGIGFFATFLWFYLFRIPFVHTANIKILLCGIIMVVLGLLFMALLNYFLGILTLKFEEINIFLMIKDNLSAFVTGAVIPLALLPEWMIAFYNVEKNLESCSFCMQQHIAVPVYSQGKNVPAGLPL